MRSLLLPLLIAGTCLSSASSVHAQEVPLSLADKQHLLYDDFRIIRKVKDLPPSIQHWFPGPTPNGSFRAVLRWVFNDKEVYDRHYAYPLADAGEKFQADCMVEHGVPSRRLILAGRAGNYCFLQYEHGGIAAGRQILLFRLSWGRPNLVWVGSGPYFADIATFRKLLLQNRFSNGELMIM